MPTTDLTELLAIVERIRAETHPEIDTTFLQAVLRAEEANQEDAAEAVRSILAALKASLAGKGAS